MSAEFEEVVMASTRSTRSRPAQNLRQGLFGLALSGSVAAGGEGFAPWRRQRAAVELAVGVQRQRFERDVGRRNHVLGRLAPRCASVSAPGAAAVRLRCVIRDRPAVAGRILPREHNRLAHAPMLGEPRLDLAELDPEDPDLHLEIVAAEILDPSVLEANSAKIPSPVSRSPAAKGLAMNRSAVSSGRSIAPANLHAANINLAGTPMGTGSRSPSGCSIRVFEIGRPDRNGRHKGAYRRGPGGRLDRRLCRSIEVVQLNPGKSLIKEPHEAGRQRFAAREHPAQAGAGRGFGGLRGRPA